MSRFSSGAIGQLGAGLRALVVLTLVVGVVYPLVMTGLAQVVFPGRADGSLLRRDGASVGSSLIGQSFTVGKKATVDAGYFQSRPSAAGDGYDPLASSASNLSPDNPDLLALVRQRRAAVARLDGHPGSVPADALLASGSGLDPHISPAYAELQVPRVATARDATVGAVRRLVSQYTVGRTLGFIGEPRVNVLLLNLALDRAFPASSRAH
jgi:K+-transporting ATPase ATPase C chain